MNYFNIDFNPYRYIRKDDPKDIDLNELYDRYMQECMYNYDLLKHKAKGNNLKFLRKINRQFLNKEHCVEKLKEDALYHFSYKIKPSDLVYAIDNKYMKKALSKQELENLKKMVDAGKKLGIKVGVFDHLDVFSYEEVENANKIINEQANFIKKQDYSPLEKLLNAYLIVANNEYKSEVEEKESRSQSRSIYGVLNSDKIVCTGFSNYLKTLVKELNDSNLKVFTNYVGTKRVKYAKTRYGLHTTNIVYIKDDKYKIDGFYYLDSTWDAHDLDDVISLRYFLLGIDQIKNIKEAEIIRNDESRARISEDNEVNNGHTGPKKKLTSNFLYTYSIPYYASVSNNKVDLSREKRYLYRNDISDELISRYLITRQDFKDYVILKETMHEFKNSKLSFDELLEKNAELVEKDIKKTKVFNDEREMFKYLKQHSKHIDIGPIQNALQKVYSANNPDKSKDEISKMVYDTLKANIKLGKEALDGDKALWTECENLK